MFEDNIFVSEELRLAHKILKNSGFVPPEIELKKEIKQTEDLLADIKDVDIKDIAEKYRLIKKLNFLIMKLNLIRNISITHETPQPYTAKLTEHLKLKSLK